MKLDPEVQTMSPNFQFPLSLWPIIQWWFPAQVAGWPVNLHSPVMLSKDLCSSVSPVLIPHYPEGVMKVSSSKANKDSSLKLGEAPIPPKSRDWEWEGGMFPQDILHSVSGKREEPILCRKQHVSTILAVFWPMQGRATLTSLVLEQCCPIELWVMAKLLFCINAV